MDTAFPVPNLPPGYGPGSPFNANDWAVDPTRFYAYLTKTNTFTRWAKFLADVTIDGWLRVGGGLFSVSPTGDAVAASLDVGDLTADNAVIATLGATSGAFSSLTASSASVGALTATSLAVSSAITAVSLTLSGVLTAASAVFSGQMRSGSILCSGQAVVDQLNATFGVLGGMVVTGSANIVTLQSTTTSINTLTVNSSASIPVLTVLTSATIPNLAVTGQEQINSHLAIAGNTAIAGNAIIAGQTIAAAVQCSTLTCTAAITAPNLQRTSALIYLSGIPVPGAGLPIIRSIDNPAAAYGGIDMKSQLAADGSGTNLLVYPGFCVRFYGSGGGQLLFECDNASGADLKWAVIVFSPGTVLCDRIAVFYLGTPV